MTFIFIVLVLIWITFLAHALRSVWAHASLDDFPLSLTTRPKISIIIAVKDNADEIEATLRHLLNKGYPSIELIVVNDRSQDRTPEILDRLAQLDPRILPVHIHELPSRWLGKVHALHQGIQKATSEYVLFMDADMGASEEVVTHALSIFEDQKLDHLTILPHIAHKGPALDLLMATSNIMFTTSARPWLRMEDRPLKCIKGVGKFNLIRLSSFKKTEGFEWLRMEIADDVAFAAMMAKNHGRSLYLKAGRQGPHLVWYQSLKEMVLGLEKNVVGGFTNYKVTNLFIMSGFALAPLLIALVALICGQFAVVALFLIANLIFALLASPPLKYHVSCLFLFPLGLGLLSLTLIRSFIICYRNNGVTWSGTHYSLEELKRNQRVRLTL